MIQGSQSRRTYHGHNPHVVFNEMLEGLHVDVRVHRSYFELKVSLLNGKEANLLKHHMLCYHWTDYYTILEMHWHLTPWSSLLGRCPSPDTELSNHSYGR